MKWCYAHTLKQSGLDHHRLVPPLRRRTRLGSGFVFNTVHNILPEVPPQNIVAMFEGIEEFNR